MARSAILLFLFVAACSDGAGESADQRSKWMLKPHEWAETCDAAADDLLALLPEDERADFAHYDLDDAIGGKFGWGLTVRNRQGLWRGNSDLIRSCVGDGAHPDAASAEILRLARRKLRSR